MSRAARVGGVLVAAAVAGCASACSADAPAPRASASSTASPTVPPSTSAAPTATASAGTTASTDFGYFTSVESTDLPIRLSFDRAQLFTGAEANKQAGARGDQTPVPNDIYIVNENPRLRPVSLAEDVKVTGSLGLNTYAGDSGVEPTSRTVQQLVGFLGTAQGRQTPFRLVYDRAGLVVSVEEQYVP